MEVQIVHDKSAAFNFLKNHPELQVYCIGDLDDFFWPKTIWYGLIDDSEIQSLAVLYVGLPTPTLLLFYQRNPFYPLALLDSIKPMLPGKFFAHLSPGLVNKFGQQNVLKYYGLNYKMALRKPVSETNDENIARLTITDLPKITALYSIAYPGNWFDERMLETGKYFGYFAKNDLVGIVGIHVYSEKYRAAALGNIATHPDYRGQQIASKLTSTLCHDLSKTVDYIGLNVKANNDHAIQCYKKIGFEIVGEHDECYIQNV